MEYNTLALPSGLRVIHLPSASPVVYCGYAIAAGTRDELPGQEGMAHFCEHTTFKGTARRRAWHILNCLESVGGDLNAFTTKEDTVYYAATLRDHVARAVDLLTEKAAVFPSKGEMRKTTQGGGVSINKEKLSEFDALITTDHLLNEKYLLVQKGKKNYFLIIAK